MKSSENERPAGGDKIKQEADGSANKNFRKIIIFFYILVSLALLFTALGAGNGTRLIQPMNALLWALGCMLTGALGGFLFGIPKILQSGRPPAGPNKDGTGTERDNSYRQQVNTNLTEISDWLTKIIVGLGLINLTKIPAFIDRLAEVFSASLSQPNAPDHHGFAIAVIVGFTVIGFLFGYLATRLYLTSAFAIADIKANTYSQQTADAASAGVESLRDALSVLEVKINQLSSPPAGEEPAAADADSHPPTQPTALPDQEAAQASMALTDDLVVQPPILPLCRKILELAKQYTEFDAPSREERVRQRDDYASQMAALINQNDLYRDWAVKTARAENNIGLVVGLAVAINSTPAPKDLKRLLKVAALDIPYKHARYKIAAALGRLFDARIATANDIRPVLAILTDYYRNQADASLQRRVRQTLAQISQGTGQNVDLAP